MLLADLGSFTGRILGIMIGLYVVVFILRLLQEMAKGMNDFMKGD